MAKQTSLIKINGKADGQSFYTSKNGGALMRSINKGMSARVKDSKEYANTRKNNAEFGACGDFAGALIGTITQRWRFILDSTATGKMVKALKAAIVQDTTGKWGERVLKAGSAPAIINAFNSLSKNDMLQSVKNALSSNLVYNTVSSKYICATAANLSNEDEQQLESLGANGLTVVYYVLKVSGLSFNNDTHTYDPAEVEFVPMDSLSGGGDLGTGTLPDVMADDEFASGIFPQSEDSELVGVLAIAMPYRKVGGVTNVLQQHCAAYLVEPVVVNE